MPDQIDAILANTEAHGFAFFTDSVEHEGRTFREAQLVRHLDVDKLRATFGDAFFFASMDGTSRHVTNQRINRTTWYAALGEEPSRKVTQDELRRLVVANMLGLKSARRKIVVTETKYEAFGKKFDTQEAATAYGVNVLREKGLDDEMIADILGVTPDVIAAL